MVENVSVQLDGGRVAALDAIVEDRDDLTFRSDAIREAIDDYLKDQ